MKGLRTLRLDGSDTFLFPRAAEADEVAVVGSFLFWTAHGPGQLEGREAQAFRAGFLGLDSWGFATLAMVASCDDAAWSEAEMLLAARLVEHCGAPDLATARPAAREELAFAESVAAGHPPGTVIALQRDWLDGAIRERFRTLNRRADTVRDWSREPVIGFVADDGSPAGDGADSHLGDEAEPVDLTRMLRREP